MKFKTDRTLATPEAAEKKLLEIANAIEADHACWLSVAAINIRNFEMQAATPMSTVLRFPPQSRRAGSCCIRPAFT
jgi:hypothetical protein